MERKKIGNRRNAENRKREINSKIRECSDFRKGIVNLFFEGSTIPILSRTFPLFEVKKLSVSKLNFEVGAMIDTLVRYFIATKCSDPSAGAAPSTL